MQLLAGWVGRWGWGRGYEVGTVTAAGYCTIWALVAMLVSFRALMALTILFLLLLVEGWDENANTQSEHIRCTHARTHARAHTHTQTHTHRCIRIIRLLGNWANVGRGSQAVES